MNKINCQKTQIFYFAKQIYQFSNALPLYNSTGGTFIVNKRKKIIQFKKYLVNTNKIDSVKTFLNTPPFRFHNFKKDGNPCGILISMSNAPISHDATVCKTIFIGHGTGDKKYRTQNNSLEQFDFHFITGPKHMEKLKDISADIPQEKLIKTGNLRFDDYINKKINTEHAYINLGIKDRDRKNVLYAPTWKWGNGTLHRYVYRFARDITREHNLIVRPHFHDRQYISGIKLWAKLNGIKHLYFSNPAAVATSDTMDVFKISDILLSDTSSITYEYLITRKPIIIVQHDYQKLHSMPDALNIMKYVDYFSEDQDIMTIVNENLRNDNIGDRMNWLLHQCFYFNDGKSVSRALNFVNSIQF